MVDIKKVGVVGAGTMGNGIAQVFAQSGFGVRLCDAAPAAIERARATIDKSLGKFVEKGRLTAEARDAALGRLSSGCVLLVWFLIIIALILKRFWYYWSTLI